MNIQHGFGKKQYCNSDVYEGLWKEGVHEGCGKYAWNSGNIYIGNWKRGCHFEGPQGRPSRAASLDLHMHYRREGVTIQNEEKRFLLISMGAL